MRKSIPQFAIVREKSAQTFEEKLNERILELADEEKEVTFGDIDGDMIARIEYRKTVHYDAPQLPKSETGIRFTCGDCPMLQPVLTRKGTVDGRVKYGTCPHCERGGTLKSTPACEVLYNMIINGEVSLCLSRQE